MDEVTSLDEHVEHEPCIFSLPPEIMLMIFSYCSALELVSSVQFVCARWHELVKFDPSWRWKTLFFKGNTLRQNFEKLLGHVSFICSVSFERCTSCIDVISLLSQYCKNLYSLKISSSRFSNISGLTTLNSLVHVDICIDWLDNQHELLFELPSLITLETVVLKKFFYKDSIAVHLIEKCPRLQHLALTKLESMEQYISFEKEVTPLDIDKTRTVPYCLQTVYIFGERLLSRQILGSIEKVKTLMHIVLKPTNYSNDEISTLLFSETRHSLTTLDIGYASCVSDCLLQTVSRSCPNLKNLILTRCDIGDAALKFIANSLFKIEKLNLHGTRVTSVGLSSLPSNLPNLKDLSLRACRRIQFSQLSSFVQQLPELRIELPRLGLLAGHKAEGRASPFLVYRNEIK